MGIYSEIFRDILLIRISSTNNCVQRVFEKKNIYFIMRSSPIFNCFSSMNIRFLWFFIYLLKIKWINNSGLFSEPYIYQGYQQFWPRVYVFYPILFTNVFATDLRWSNSTILITKNDTFVFPFCYCWIVLNFLLLCASYSSCSLFELFPLLFRREFTFPLAWGICISLFYICKRITF